MPGDNMAEQQSRLAIVIDSTGAQRNAEGLAGALARISQAGQEATLSAEELSGASKDLNGSFKAGAKYREDVIKGLSGATKSTEDQAKAFAKLRAQIDPVSSALDKLDDHQQQLAKFKSLGIVDSDTFLEYSKKIEETRSRLTGFDEQLKRTGMTSKQMANNLRMVPAQFTDIIVSLQAGQNPFQVFLQQGGQLKDMFGGIGPAVRGLGTYLAGLATPAASAAATLSILAFAYNKGAQEGNAFTKSLILNGNILGITSGELGQMAEQVSKFTGATVGNAAAVLNQIAASGKIASGSIALVTDSIVSMSKATGQSAEGMVSSFEKIADSPLEAVSKLNDQYHFLTVSTYNQIKALQEEGNQQEATRVATEAYANTMIQRSSDIEKNLGSLERAWNSLTGAAKGAWDAMLDIGRQQTPEAQLANLEASLADARQRQAEGGLWNRFTANANGYNIGDMEQKIATLKSQITTQDVLNNAISDYQGRQDKAIKTQQEADKVNQQYITNSQRRVKAIQQQSDFLKAGAITQEQYANNISRINEMYKDPRQPKGKAYTEDAGTRMLDQLRQQQQVLLSQADTGDKIGTQQQALIKWEQQLADIKSKQTLTADQKSLLASSDRITAQLQQNAAIEKEIQSREKLLALDKARANINRTIANRQSQYSTEELFSSGGMSQYDQQQYTQRLSLEQSYNDKITQLRQQRASATSDIAREEIDQEIELQRQALSTELSNYDSHMERMNASRRSFTAGASRAWQEYQDSAANVSAMSQQLFSNAFSGMEDALVNFAVSGKASFRDFANSVISDLARIAARQAITGLVGSLFSAGVSGASGAAASPSSGSTGALGMSTSFRAYAKGGVPGGNSISDYRNGVYDSPQFFAFAKGAGVFGEAGPEAIMPLARGSDGSLGVRMVSNGGGGGTGVTVNAPVSIVQNSSDTGSVNTANTAASAKMLQSMITQTINDWAKKAMSPGGNLYNGGRG